MVYRDFGNTGVRLSPLGFGMMRLPEDEKTSVEMVRSAIDAGINYIDTAYNYLGGNSEFITARALADGYRDMIHLATKMPVWMIEGEHDFDRILGEQLKRLQTDQIDFYLLHALNRDSWKKVLRFDLLRKMQEAREAGKVCYLGFSFHDTFDLFKEIIDAFEEWDFCQIQLNYTDVYYQAGLKGMKYAGERGIGIVIMEPLRGGFLANVPREVSEVFSEGERCGFRRTPAEWAFDFLWDLPEVGVVLSGMSTPEQVAENISYAERSAPGMLSEAEHQILKKAYRQFLNYNAVPCTGCAYCMHCPKGIAIPQSIAAYNEAFKEHNYKKAKKQYEEWVPLFGAKPSACISCRQCEAICPQQLEVSKWMHEIDSFFTKESGRA